MGKRERERLIRRASFKQHDHGNDTISSEYLSPAICLMSNKTQKACWVLEMYSLGHKHCYSFCDTFSLKILQHKSSDVILTPLKSNSLPTSHPNQAAECVGRKIPLR